MNDEINNDNPEFNIEENVVGDDDGSNYSDDDEQEPDILEPQYTETYKLKGTTILDKIVGTLYIYLAKYEPHFQQGLTVPPSPYSMLH